MSRPFAPIVLCATVTPMLAFYGAHWWSGLFGPAAAIGLQVLHHATRPAAEPAQEPSLSLAPQAAPSPVADARAA
jgi:hypothetical protein